MAGGPELNNELKGATFTGPVIQGRDMQLSISSATPQALAGLPAQRVFIGRDAELATLADALCPSGPATRGTVVISAVAGPAGTRHPLPIDAGGTGRARATTSGHCRQR